jgi:hypothetical protein
MNLMEKMKKGIIENAPAMSKHIRESCKVYYLGVQRDSYTISVAKTIDVLKEEADKVSLLEEKIRMLEFHRNFLIEVLEKRSEIV